MMNIYDQIHISPDGLKLSTQQSHTDARWLVSQGRRIPSEVNIKTACEKTPQSFILIAT